MNTKTCPYCKIEKLVDEFNKNPLTKDGLMYECKPCGKTRRREYHARNRDVQLEKSKQWREKFKLEHNGKHRLAVVRDEVLDAYGSRCACCKEDRKNFLSLDHVNGGGGKIIRERGAQYHYSDAKRRGFPPDYRVLCHNCNFALGHYGFCPHQKEGVSGIPMRFTWEQIESGTWRKEYERKGKVQEL